MRPSSTQAYTGTTSCSSSSRPGTTRSSWAPTAPLGMTVTSPTACSAWAMPPSKLRALGGWMCAGANEYLSKGVCFASAAAAKLLQLCPTLCDPIDSSPPGSAAPRCANAGSKGTSISKPFKTYRQIVFQTDVQIYILTSKV